ncbi:hypothetical protein ACIP4X_17600 [Streptomyces sp. NPDC088817]|uniref:hypothetical protein n=1 Tax=Streptomyces sp. NPDC088817 TaxID=3365907 RepID=UPI0038228259
MSDRQYPSQQTHLNEILRLHAQNQAERAAAGMCPTTLEEDLGSSPTTRLLDEIVGLDAARQSAQAAAVITRYRPLSEEQFGADRTASALDHVDAGPGAAIAAVMDRARQEPQP